MDLETQTRQDITRICGCGSWDQLAKAKHWLYRNIRTLRSDFRVEMENMIDEALEAIS